ncbi:nicotinate-nucleotide--dimethylbenzimidazole phosphoribosyltransferase [Paucibacter aquatile]|uniref:Nicotinate-nucleotide--dimethylbenzimidazole phosphoribosyltransferase n=1 Tax=Kinneretia aquatilis TaxID=2070761 RepID=A0A2N8L2T7_9BURK|nr:MULTISPECIES: nicotinate-nucleotide--dimethylbenzimidazole phosphoribosyltransferase [Roseateles]PND40012.1 nicotinate-nucleotide--dimethylbenzimidazole phosphoribosyltransferase [Paucibacter aquatile]WIV98852.1 nicotinate-nucleotide--dimethylbenzimidazole phosphoribosyltransferase [Paucibacter aquatile]
MSLNQSLISPTANPELEKALRDRVDRHAAIAGGLGELEPLAVRLGLVQNSLTPRFRDPVLALFAADHGLVVDRIGQQWGRSTREQAQLALQNRLPVSVFARLQGLQLAVVDCGIAESLPPHARLMARKIAHGTRNTRTGPAMTLEQAHAGVRVGMEISDNLPGNVLACASMGQGSAESAALVLSRLMDLPVREFVVSGPDMRQDELNHILGVLHAAQARHREVSDPMEVLAAFGGFELAVMMGAMLVAASKRHLIIVDGITACAALKLAARIAAPVTDYAVFCRSHVHRGLDEALATFHASALLELGMDSADGTGATLAWPMIRAAAALLTDLHDLAEARPPNTGSGVDSLSGGVYRDSGGDPRLSA